VGSAGDVLKIAIEAILVMVLLFEVELCDGHLCGLLWLAKMRINMVLCCLEVAA
jgi:hypothetical protein